MRITGPTVARTERGRARRSFVLHADDGARHEVAVEGPVEAIDRSDELTGALCLALPIAMRTAEVLEVAGPVDPLLADRLEDLQALYLAWDRAATPTEVRIGSLAHHRRHHEQRQVAAFFSRGVDSAYTAARPRRAAERLDALVFVDGLEPVHGEEVRRVEVDRARAMAERLDLELLAVRAEVRAPFEAAGFDWEDAVGPALASVAHALGRRFRRMTIPSGDSYATVEPAGTSPLLDPLLSSERVEIVHDSIARSRLGKVGWLAAERPELLADLKVCFKEDRPDNCGRCGKCLLTMACLEAHGVLGAARGFPDAIDLDAIRAFRLPMLKARQDWAELAAALDPDGPHADLRAAALATIATSALDGPRDRDRDGNPTWVGPWWLRNHRLNETLSLVVDGRPYPPLPGVEPAPVAPTEPTPAAAPAAAPDQAPEASRSIPGPRPRRWGAFALRSRRRW